MANPLQVSLYKQYMHTILQCGSESPYSMQAAEGIRQLLIQCGPLDPDLKNAEDEVIMERMSTSTSLFPRIRYR